jgi:hypothetical protein
MDIFSIDLTIPEIQTLRQSLDVINVSGKDAKFLAGLQIKLETELQQITDMLNAAQVKKQQELEKAVATDKKLK